MNDAPTLPPTRVRSVPTSDPGDLLARMPTPDALAWVRSGDGLVAWGEAARLEIEGPDRFARAADWWAKVVAALDVEDAVEVPGSGPVAFASFTFDDGPGTSVVVLPRVVVGRRAGAAWVTTVGDGTVDDVPVLPVPGTRGVSYADGSVSPTAYEHAVAEAVGRIRAGELDKVVLARDLVVSVEDAVDPRALLGPLSRSYPSCWTYAVDGLVGATPELLVRRTSDHVVSRVLAGTAGRSNDAEADARLTGRLLASVKDRAEHEMAVRSVADALRPACAELVVPRTPEVVRLANVQHLATDVTGRLADGETALDLAGALHPTAAVCGTPTDAAMAVIRQLEGLDRGRYAGPVGWVDARGDGEFGIALRCAQVDGDRLHLFAGCGIVAGSDPAEELAESQAKLTAIRDAVEAG